MKQGGVLSPILFSLYLDNLIADLRSLKVGCHINGLFVGAVVYADDITLLGPSRSSIMSLLNVCESYARDHDILFNPTKTTCTYFSLKCNQSPGKQMSFMNNDVMYVDKCTFLGISLDNRDITDRNIENSTYCLYRRANELLCDFKCLNRELKSSLFSTYCLDAYGSQLWKFYNNSNAMYFTAWRKIIRKLWCLPYQTHCRFLHTINDSIPIDVILEKRCIKFLWSSINSFNQIVKSLSLSSIKCSSSVFGENYRFLSYKYNILPTDWFLPFYHILNKIELFVKTCHVHYPEASFIRELCIQIDSEQFSILSSQEMCQLIEYLCTI